MGSLFVALLPTLLAAAEPTTLVVLSRRVSVTPAEAQAVVSQATTLLLEAGAPLVEVAEAGQRLSKLGLKDATTCNGKPVCHAEFGKQLKVSWLILVSVSRVAGDRSLALELFEVAGRTVADRESFILPKGTALTRQPLEDFAGRLAARLAPAPVTAELPPDSQLKTDTPVKPALTPGNTVTALPPPLPTPEPKGHAPSFILGGLGVAALGAAVALFVVGANTQAQVQGTAGADGRVRSTLTGSEAQAAAGAASLQLGLGGAAAAVGVGLGTTAVVLW
ncbi:MAG: hypothetical protein Q8L48_36570 [Archangium sp.]|nr:hypothetical protein [Archangium sp.]